MTTVMFLGMSFCLPLAFLEERQKAAQAAAAANGEAEPLLEDGNGQSDDGAGPSAEVSLPPSFAASGRHPPHWTNWASSTAPGRHPRSERGRVAGGQAA